MEPFDPRNDLIALVRGCAAAAHDDFVDADKRALEQIVPELVVLVVDRGHGVVGVVALLAVARAADPERAEEAEVELHH